MMGSISTPRRCSWCAERVVIRLEIGAQRRIALGNEIRIAWVDCVSVVHFRDLALSDVSAERPRRCRHRR